MKIVRSAQSMKKYQVYNYWSSIRDERARMDWQELCNRSKAKDFENEYAVRIHTLNDDILLIQKKYIKHDEEGAQIRIENVPQYHEGMNEEMLNAEFAALMDQDITQKYSDLKFVYKPIEAPKPNETEPANETGEKGNTETEPITAETESGSGGTEEKDTAST